jgi:hypothetical protein
LKLFLFIQRYKIYYLRKKKYNSSSTTGKTDSIISADLIDIKEFKSNDSYISPIHKNSGKSNKNLKKLLYSKNLNEDVNLKTHNSSKLLPKINELKSLTKNIINNPTRNITKKK